MESIEILLLRAYSQLEKEEAISVFHQLNLVDSEIGCKSITLYKDISIIGDISIIICWQHDICENKSRLGSQLAQAFSEFGQVNHSCLIKEYQIDV